MRMSRNKVTVCWPDSNMKRIDDTCPWSGHHHDPRMHTAFYICLHSSMPFVFQSSIKRCSKRI